MNAIKKLSIPLVLAVLLTCGHPVQAYKSPIIKVSSSDIYLTAGQENSISISLRNIGDFKVFDVEAFLTSATSGVSILLGAHNVYAEIDKETTKSYNPTIYVNQDVPLGSYTLTLSLVYRRADAVAYSTVTVPIGVVVNKRFIPRLEFTSTQSKYEIKSGTENKVEYIFTNTGEGPLRDIDLILTSTSPFISIADGANYDLDELNISDAFGFKPVISVLEGTPLGAYSLTATATYVDNAGIRYQQIFSLPLSITSVKVPASTTLTIGRVEVLQNSVHPGDSFDLMVEVECSGAEANDVTSTLSLGPMGAISSISPTKINIGYMEPDESTEIKYRLLAGGDIQADEYQITITLGYTDSRAVPKSLTEMLTVLVEGIVEFKLLDAPILTLERGRRVEIEADLLLIGTEKVQFVSVELLEDNVIRRVTGSDEYIGAVDPDSPLPFNLDLKVDEAAPLGEHDIEIKITYRDHMNKEHEQILEIDATVSEARTPVERPRGLLDSLWIWVRRMLGLTP